MYKLVVNSCFGLKTLITDKLRFEETLEGRGLLEKLLHDSAGGALSLKLNGRMPQTLDLLREFRPRAQHPRTP